MIVFVFFGRAWAVGLLAAAEYLPSMVASIATYIIVLRGLFDEEAANTG